MKKKLKALIFDISGFILFFVIISFVVTCSFLLFMHGMEFTEEEIGNNAKVTFVNIFIITTLFFVIDKIRRKFTVDRPVEKITKALEEITDGNFSVKISSENGIAGYSEFNEIIEHINLMTNELKSVETLKTDFISNVSHELKTPLAVIQNYGTMLQSGDLSDEERVEYAKAVTQAARNLASLVTNILKLNKLENQQIFPEKTTYNLSEQVCECMLSFESVWEKKNIEIETDIDEDVLINADSELLSVVWNNLFSNAVKFTENGGKISVFVKKDGEEVSVSVADTGCGMSNETGKHIFEKFYQGDTSHSSKGNGLGLALVKRVIDIMDGEISVKSELNKGSVFTVRLRGVVNG